MPIINITPKMISQQHPPDGGIHLVKFVGIEERPTADKKAILYVLEFEIVKTKGNPNNIGRLVYHRVSSNGLQFFIPVVAALNDIPIDAVSPGELNMDMLIEKECGVEVEDGVFNGRITKNIKNFMGVSNIEPPF